MFLFVTLMPLVRIFGISSCSFPMFPSHCPGETLHTNGHPRVEVLIPNFPTLVDIYVNNAPIADTSVVVSILHGLFFQNLPRLCRRLGLLPIRHGR